MYEEKISTFISMTYEFIKEEDMKKYEEAVQRVGAPEEKDVEYDINLCRRILDIAEIDYISPEKLYLTYTKKVNERLKINAIKGVIAAIVSDSGTVPGTNEEQRMVEEIVNKYCP